MDSRAAERLIRSLSFDVEAIPQQDNALKAPANQAPMNLKIRVRKKEGMVLQKNTVLTIPNMSHPERAPERVRLASSDTTIMSFDVLMETDSEKRPAKKHRRLFGGCFGTQSDDEDAPYEPSSTKKDSKSDTNLTLLKGHGNEIEKSVFTESRNTTFFGKCKPGGCLDPPFGEDRYKYQPKLTTTAKDSSQDLKITSSKDKITNKRLSKDRPSQNMVITTPERGKIRNKSDSTEKDSENIKYKINSRQTSKSSLIGAKIIETVVGSKTIIVKELRKSNDDLDTARGSGRSSRDGSPEIYSQTKRGSRYQVLEPIVKRGRDNSIERESKTKNYIPLSEHTMKRNSRENSPERNKPMHEKSQHPQQIPDSGTLTYEQQKLLGNDDTATANTRKQVKRDSKGQEQRGLTQMYSQDPDKYYERGSTDRIMERPIQMSSIEPSPEPKGLTQNNSHETYKGRGSRDRIPDINRQVKQSSREHSPESTVLTQMEPNKCYQRDSRDSIPEMDRRVKIISREDSREPKGITQINSSEPNTYYRRGSRDHISERDRQVKQSSRERSPESETSMKKVNIDHIPVFEDGTTGIIQENETKYLKTVESQRSEKTKVEFTKENSNMTTRKMSSNAQAKGVDEPDNTRSDALKERDSCTTKQKKPNKRISKVISGDVSNIMVDDTDSIITYPPAMSSSELRLEEKKIEKRNTSKRNSISNSISSSRARSSVNEFTNKYFSPPKKDKVRDSYASILNPSQDNVFIGPGEKETTRAKTDTISDNLPKERNLESVDITVEKTHPNETSEILKKSPYAISKDSNIRDDMNISMPKGRMSIDTLDRKQEININSHYKPPIQIRSDLADETQDYPFISRSEMFEDDVADDTQQNATFPRPSDEMDRNRPDDQLSENGIVYQQSQNLAKISKSRVQTNNITDYETKYTEKDGNDEFDDKNNSIFNKMSENQIYKDNVAIHGRDSTTGMNKEPNFAQDRLSYEQSTIRNAIAQENKDSALFRTLNDAEKVFFHNNENYLMGNTFQDPKSYINETSARYSSVGNNEAISLTSNVQDKNADYYFEDTSRNYDLYDEEGKSIKNVNGDRINDSFVQVRANEYVKSSNYLRLQDEMTGKEPDDQNRPPYFKEDNYYAPATDIENKSPYFNEDDHYVSETVPENKSPSEYQNSVDINSFRTLDEAVKADSNDTRSKSYHSGDSRLPVKDDFTQLHAKQIRESTDAGIKSQDWQDMIRKEGIDPPRAATPPRSYMRDSEKVGGNELYAENEQQRAKETKRQTQPVEYYDDNQSHNGGSGKQVDSIFLELAIQTHVKSEDAILKTSDLSSGSRTRVVKAVLNAQNEKVRIPIDDQNELSIQYKKVIPGSTASSQRIQFLLPRTQSQSRQESEVMGSTHTANMKDDRRGDMKGTASYPNPLLSLERFGSDLRETLSYVYENQLVPLQNTIKSLKEDIDFLASQQLLLRDRIHGTSSSRRIRPVRLIHSSKRCVCIGNPRY